MQTKNIYFCSFQMYLVEDISAHDRLFLCIIHQNVNICYSYFATWAIWLAIYFFSALSITF